MSKVMAEREYKKLSSIMRKHAVRFPKKHGNWLRLYLGGRDVLFMDTWNGAITAATGDCEYCYWTGFVRCTKRFLAGDFGGFINDAGFLEIREYIERANKAIGVKL